MSELEIAVEHRPSWIVGAGLAGALLARLLCRTGKAVHVSERRSSVALEQLAPGRSINLALATRGRTALAQGGLVRAAPEADAEAEFDLPAQGAPQTDHEAERLVPLESLVMAQAIAMPGRQVHLLDGSENFQPYASDGCSAIWSVHRARMNRSLLHAAKDAGASVHFNERVVSLDLANRLAVVERSHPDVKDPTAAPVQVQIRFEQIYGCDGAGSIIREAIAKLHPEVAAPSVEFLDHGYRELSIPPLIGADGSPEFQLSPNALHIWPRRAQASSAKSAFMLIALPNPDKSFTATLFMPNQGELSFASLAQADAVEGFFEQYFPDLQARIPDYLAQMQTHPVGLLGTLRCESWFYQDAAVILGDAAHAIVPFHGQGMNCALEDCVALSELMLRCEGNIEAAFEGFAALRKPQAEAIAQMALENYLDMRDGVADANFLLRKALEKALSLRNPQHFLSRYEMVSFSNRPYADALARGQWQSALLAEFCAGKTNLDEIDLDAASAKIQRELAPL